MPTPADIATTWLPIAGGVCAVVAAVWRVYAGVNERIDLLTQRLGKLVETILMLQQAMAVSERDRAKLEGRIELLATELARAIAGMQQLTGSTDALWRTMEIVAPDQVRRRRGQ